MITISVYGDPVAQPRQRVSFVGGFVRTHLPRVKDKITKKKVPHPVINYKKFIAIHAEKTMRLYGNSPLVGPVHVEMRFYLAPPKKYKKWELDESQHQAAIQSKPDLDNLAKAVLDALTGIVYKDDSQVVSLALRKENANHPRLLIQIRPITV